MKRVLLAMIMALCLATTAQAVPIVLYDSQGNEVGTAANPLNVGISGDITLENGEEISNTDDGRICFELDESIFSEDICLDMPGTNAIDVLSTSGVASFDMLVSLGIDDDIALRFGQSVLNTADARMQWETTGNDNLQIGVAVGDAAYSGYVSVMEASDMGHANRSPSGVATNPTLRVYSADEAETDDYLEAYHDGAGGTIRVKDQQLNLVYGSEINVRGSGTDTRLTFQANDSSTNIGGIRLSTTQEQTTIASGNTSGNQFVFTHNDYITSDHDHDRATDPTVFIHSYTNPNTDNTQWGSLHYSAAKDAFVVGTGGGNLDIGADQMSYKLAGEFLDVLTEPIGLYVWASPATTEPDLSGNGHDATYAGSMTTGDQVNKGFVWALDPDGVNDYAYVSDNAAHTFGDGSNDSAFSGVVWTDVAGVVQVALMSKWDSNSSGGTEREWMFEKLNDKTIRIRLYDESAGIQIDRTTNAAVSDGWHMVAFTYAGTGGATAADDLAIYVDGAVAASTATNNASYVSMEDRDVPFRVGAVEGGSGMTLFQNKDFSVNGLTGEKLSDFDIWKLYVKTCGYLNACQ